MNEKNLIVYYSLSGNTKRVAECIKEKVNGDIEELILEKPYSKISSFTRGLVNIKSGKYPKVKNKIDFSEYDNIFLGAPIWYFTINPVVAGFLVNNKIDGKNIYPFCTDDGSSGDWMEKTKEFAKGANVGQGLEVISVKKKTDEEISKIVEEWIDKINV